MNAYNCIMDVTLIFFVQCIALPRLPCDEPQHARIKFESEKEWATVYLYFW